MDEKIYDVLVDISGKLDKILSELNSIDTGIQSLEMEVDSTNSELGNILNSVDSIDDKF